MGAVAIPVGLLGGILGIGITFIMLGGGMDLSTGYLISTVGVAMAIIDLSTNFVVSLICGILLAVLISAFNGAVDRKSTRLNSSH